MKALSFANTASPGRRATWSTSFPSPSVKNKGGSAAALAVSSIGLRCQLHGGFYLSTCCVCASGHTGLISDCAGVAAAAAAAGFFRAVVLAVHVCQFQGIPLCSTCHNRHLDLRQSSIRCVLGNVHEGISSV